MIRVKAEELREFCQKVFVCVGLEKQYAEIMADTIVEANLRGVDTHGLMRLPLYAGKIERGIVNSNLKDVKYLSQYDAVCLIDGSDCPGQVLGIMAMEKAIDMASRTGVGVVGVRNSNNFGAAAYYSMKASSENMIGLTMAETGSNLAPYGGAEAVLGNNPMAIALPAGEYPDIVLDMAMSVVAGGKVRQAAQEGKPVPLGWIVNSDGEPTTDTADYLERKGCLVPLAGHKGSGLSTVIGMLAGVLTGPNFGVNVGLAFSLLKPSHSGQFYAALDVAKFCALDEFKQRMDQQIKTIKSCRPAKGFQEVLVPGEKEYYLRKEHLKDGIPLSTEVINNAKEFGSRFGVAFPSQN